MSDIINKLRDDSQYYGDFGSVYLSNSDIDALLNNPKEFKKKKEKTKPMLEGSYFHTALLEPEKLSNFSIIDASSRNTNIYKNAIAESGEDIVLLRPEKEELDALVSTIKSNLFFYENIYAEGNVFEEPAIMEMFGVMWKGKCDIITEDFLIDIKTTSKIDDFKWSAKKYNYDSQCYIYQQLFGKPLVFYVIDKTSHRLGVFEPSEDFILGGRDKVLRAIDVYNKFYSELATEDINNFFITETL